MNPFSKPHDPSSSATIMTRRAKSPVCCLHYSAPLGCGEADSYLVYDVDEAIDCRQVVGEDGGVSNADALEKKRQQFI